MSKCMSNYGLQNGYSVKKGLMSEGKKNLVKVSETLMTAIACEWQHFHLLF